MSRNEAPDLKEAQGALGNDLNWKAELTAVLRAHEALALIRNDFKIQIYRPEHGWKTTAVTSRKATASAEGNRSQGMGMGCSPITRYVLDPEGETTD